MSVCGSFKQKVLSLQSSKRSFVGILGVQRGCRPALHQKANGQPNVDHDQSNGPLGSGQAGGDQQAGGYPGTKRLQLLTVSPYQ